MEGECREEVVFLVVLAFGALAVPAWALGGTITLHPSGFGQKSYSAWKAQEGLADRNGNGNQALYFQKNVPTPTVAAGVAVFKGYAGLPAEQLTGLEFWIRTDTHCGAGAPRFNITIRPTSGGPTQTYFVGCAGMAPGSTATAPNGTVYQQRTIAAPFTAGCCFAFPTAAGFEVVSLAIIYDEGNDFGFPCPDPGNRCAFLDNVLVQTSSTTFPTKCWTGASDNGNNTPTGPCPAPATATSGPALPTALIAQPSLTEMAEWFPDVDPLSWVFYPNVLY